MPDQGCSPGEVAGAAGPDGCPGLRPADYLAVWAGGCHRRLEYRSARSGGSQPRHAEPWGTYPAGSSSRLARNHERSGGLRGARHGNGLGYSAVSIDDPSVVQPNSSAGDARFPREARLGLCPPRYSSRAKAVRLTTPGRYPLASPCLEASALPEGECVRLGAGLVEGDLERSLADPVMLAYKLIQAAVPDHAVSVLVDVDTC